MCDWLVEQGYTHCFFVAGGNIMHFLNSARSKFRCIPVVHEVSAGIAAEYFNELDMDNKSKAFALVTAGPGLTNIITSIAGANLESRSLLVIGGQVKSSDLSLGKVRQRGIQEIDGVSLLKSLCKAAITLSAPINKSDFMSLESKAFEPRKGVVFIEVCLDVQGQPANEKLSDATKEINSPSNGLFKPIHKQVVKVKNLLIKAQRPIFLIGGGVSRSDFRELYPKLIELGVPLMSTWNAADRIPYDEPLNWGRPNTWGMRYSNILIQQSDLVIAIGTRLGLQQTGFNWQQFVPLGKIVQVDIDKGELTKGHPKLHMKICSDASHFLKNLLAESHDAEMSIDAWRTFGNKVKANIPLSDPKNNNFENYWNPYDFFELLSKQLIKGDTLIPSSSGASETVAMQAASIPSEVFTVTNKGLASMGYGLAGAIGAAFKTQSRVIHIEGDGSFSQNLQELGTVMVNKLPIKIFIFDNGGYASIKMTQRSYYHGQSIGCDIESGLGLPNWVQIFSAYGIGCRTLSCVDGFSQSVINELNDQYPRAFLVPIHPEQTYFPKITSQVVTNGTMSSRPLHLMTPDLSEHESLEYLPYFDCRMQSNLERLV
jgi:acetolactate synthase-1/2/3 large subunit